ncbi:metalloregulator ArsR/SmtB family transcription factor [[Clostridium] symbiosum]|uniref:ArsR/SmtB family transcription factor n=1 Tax=Clostridium symbiosum TaxID=1512 RepID=UPI001D07CB9C|nr:metalloregulator ArsR/SmtB family transcription factor [[Clostridium] symbiosum]MCB6607129.1 metalloregulator ArsR/SmtB family transcription factor [[Clostridium] symbiosum]MCB6929689.1 metalloregulator ArsR/SmtB family transcription factor [[Clostridium] symbiosum]
MDTESIMRVLGEPMRYRIWACLLERKHCVRSLSKKLGVSESAISQHMKVMREVGLVYGEKYGYHTHYLPNQEAVDQLLESVQKMCEQSHRLDRDITVCQCEFRKENDK